MENKQTAVEFFAGTIASILNSLNVNITDELASLLHEAESQAKAMEREQIADFIDKISSLTGYLKLWRDGKKPPLELNDLIDESDYFTKTY